MRLRLSEGFVIVNFREPEKTRALFDELAREWPDRVQPATLPASPPALR